MTGSPIADKAVREQYVKPSGNADFDQVINTYYAVLPDNSSFGASRWASQAKQELDNAVVVALTGEKTPQQALTDAANSGHASVAAEVGTPMAGVQQDGTRGGGRRRRRLLRGETLAGYAFIAPWLIGFLVFTVISMSYSLILSFTNYDLSTNTASPVGFANYQLIVADPKVLTALGNTFMFALLAVPPSLWSP